MWIIDKMIQIKYGTGRVAKGLMHQLLERFALQPSAMRHPLVGAHRPHDPGMAPAGNLFANEICERITGPYGQAPADELRQVDAEGAVDDFLKVEGHKRGKKKPGWHHPCRGAYGS